MSKTAEVFSRIRPQPWNGISNLREAAHSLHPALQQCLIVLFPPLSREAVMSFVTDWSIPVPVNLSPPAPVRMELPAVFTHLLADVIEGWDDKEHVRMGEDSAWRLFSTDRSGKCGRVEIALLPESSPGQIYIPDSTDRPTSVERGVLFALAVEDRALNLCRNNQVAVLNMFGQDDAGHFFRILAKRYRQEIDHMTQLLGRPVI